MPLPKLPPPPVLLVVAMLFTASAASAALVSRVGPLLAVLAGLVVGFLLSLAFVRFDKTQAHHGQLGAALMRQLQLDEDGQHPRWRYYAYPVSTPHRLVLFATLNELALFVLRHPSRVGKAWVVLDDQEDDDPQLDQALRAAIAHFEATEVHHDDGTTQTTDEVGKAYKKVAGAWYFSERRGAPEAYGGEPTHEVFASTPGCALGKCGHELHGLIGPLDSSDEHRPKFIIMVNPEKARRVANLGPEALSEDADPRLMLVGLVPIGTAEEFRKERPID